MKRASCSSSENLIRVLRRTFADFGDQEANGNAETEEEKGLEESLDVVDATFLETVPGRWTAAGERTDDPDFDDDELAEGNTVVTSLSSANALSTLGAFLTMCRVSSSRKSTDGVTPFSFAESLVKLMIKYATVSNDHAFHVVGCLQKRSRCETYNDDRTDAAVDAEQPHGNHVSLVEWILNGLVIAEEAAPEGFDQQEEQAKNEKRYKRE